jgi:hypothetical protein
MFKIARIIYVKKTKKFILKNSKIHIETCTHNICLRYVEDGKRNPFTDILFINDFIRNLNVFKAFMC